MVHRPAAHDAAHGFGSVGRVSYRVHAAPNGVTCDAAIHGGQPLPAIVITADDLALCEIHWLALADEIRRDGGTVTYTDAARAVLRLRGIRVD